MTRHHNLYVVSNQRFMEFPKVLVNYLFNAVLRQQINASVGQRIGNDIFLPAYMLNLPRGYFT